MTTNPLFCVTGIARSGTIWLTRLLADTLNIQSRTRDWQYDTYAQDPAVWGLDRDGGYIRRLHYRPRDYKFDSPVVLAVRDPRDTAVSQHHFYKKVNVFDRHMLWLAPRWNQFVSEWMEDKRLAIVVRYEDLHADPEPEIRRVVWHLGLDMPTNDAIHAAIEANSFPRMKNWAKRKGSVGEWRSVISPEVARQACEPLRYNMEILGYE